MKLPDKFKDEGTKLAKNLKIFGIPLESLSREELLAVAGMAVKWHQEKSEEVRRVTETWAKFAARRNA
jgi:hypothetical protein